ncbi:PDDEXK nuclease domain-containing protein [Parapedobacter sp.]
MEFYLSVLNDKVRLSHENEAIGIIICKAKDRTIVEYSIRSYCRAQKRLKKN